VRARCLSILMACLVTTRAWAQEDPRRAQAEALMKEGVALHEAHKEAEALARFQRAYAAYPTPNILFAIATSESILGRSLAALRHYREAMKASTLHPNNVQRGRDYVRDLEAKLCRIELNVPAGTTVMVDGAPATSGDNPLDAEPGDHVIEASQGEKHSRTTAKCAAGKSVAVVVDFASASSAAPSPDAVAAPTRPSSTGATRTSLAIGGGALAVVSAGVGLGFLVSSNAAVSDARAFDESTPGGACSARAACDDYRAQLGDARSARTIATLGLVSAGVFAAAAVAIYTLWPTRSASASTPSWPLRF
jgi:hypothetical protein